MRVNTVLKSLVVTAVIGGTVLIGGTAAHAAESGTPVALSASPASDGVQPGNDPWDVPQPGNDPWDSAPKANNPWDSAPTGNNPWDSAPKTNNPWD
ncbi:hypothetical protein [Streptomyces sp. IB2014 016-6]|uniref:hypothetical protein n=1 Tax=Streptomyces sp. IB2014 016-6 TaxID=2517818 RepID=UPI0011CA7FF0|nr:hypothetical protein [Streptomyces sp. IB2014 016-6]TXL85431.1 hypothetical protein EW053_30810 [Streptomyces sp. IB2014 016-6]